LVSHDSLKVSFFHGVRGMNKLILVAALLIFCWSPRVHAQATCRSEVSYSVKKGDKDQSVIVKFQEARGAEEAAVKEALTQQLAIAKQEALTLCQARHENMSSCVASKFEKTGGLMQQLQFAARVKLQDAIEADCKAQHGTCIEGKASEVTCSVIKPVETPVEATAAPDKDSGKGGKKGSKK